MKKNKKIITVEIGNDIFPYSEPIKIEDLIKQLTELNKAHKEQIIVQIEINDSDYDDAYSFCTYKDRLETNEEYKARLRSEELSAKIRKENELRQLKELQEKYKNVAN